MAKDSIGPWAVLNVLGLITMILGMFGMMEILDIEYSAVVFFVGIVITGISMFMMAIAIRRIEDLDTKVNANFSKNNEDEDN
ncbi:MAG TPA: hypothetical protein VJX93_02200 [Candidatus Methanomethylophilaceae archaeon]|jgi:drug/metabolite transporter (DMT)-like permease|nr:hypothetical protein [Candidatus Methanomethylophilaceae archaeon]